MQRKQAGNPDQQQLLRLTRLYEALRQCDQAIIRSASREELFQQICRNVVTLGDMSAAWIGLVDSKDKQVRPVAMFGSGMPFLETIASSVDPDIAQGQGPTGTAIRESRAYWCQDTASDSRVRPWREQIVAQGWRASAAIPLACAGRTVGALSMYAATVDAFDPQVRDLLEQMASNISYALDFFEQEAQLRRSQALTQRFMDLLPGTVYLKDQNLRLLMVNQYLGRMLGVSPDSLVGKTNHEIFPPDFADVVTQLDQRMMKQGGSQTFEEAFNGRHFETAMFVMDDQSGQRLLGGISLDVTERFRTVERTRALLRLQSLGEQFPEKDMLTEGLQIAEALSQSEMGFLHFVNDDQETLELVTWTAKALRGCTAVHDTHYPVSQAGIWADCIRQQQAVVFNDYKTYAHQHGLPLGHVELTRLISVPVIEGGKIRMVLGVGNKNSDYDDIDVDTLRLIGNDLWRMTRRARAEVALQQRVEELVRVNQKLAQTQLQLLQSEKMASIGQLAAGVAHEINNPIGFVKSNLGSLAQYVDDLLDIASAYTAAEGQLGASAGSSFAGVHQRKRSADYDFLLSDVKQLMDDSREGVARVSKIVQNLKDFSRAGDDNWQWSDLHLGLESTIGVVWHQLKNKAEVIREYASLPKVYCLSSQINQVILNLLVNAAQAIEQLGHITVRTGTEGEQVWIEVQDDGCGIEQKSLARIFEPFYTSKPVGQGTGLGLSIAWGIVERHQGQILVQSEPQKGSCFRVVLPVQPKIQAKGG